MSRAGRPDVTSPAVAPGPDQRPAPRSRAADDPTAAVPTPRSSVPRTGLLGLYRRAVVALVYSLAAVAMLSILVMMTITTVDVVMRRFGHPLTGAYDIVKLAGALAIACSLPYTTAVKGHVAVEFFFQKLNRDDRAFVDTFSRVLVVDLFSVLAWQSVVYGASLRESGETFMTLRWLPVYPIALVIATACAAVVLVTLYHMARPGQEMIAP